MIFKKWNYEIFYIKQYKDCNIKSLNIREGGSRGKHTEESKIRMSKPRIKRTLEHIENNRIQRMKPILRLDLNNNVLQEYDNLIGAVGEFGQGVSSCLSGKLDSFFNYKWKYKYTLDGKGLTINKYKNLTDKNNSVIQILSLVQDKKQVL